MMSVFILLMDQTLKIDFLLFSIYNYLYEANSRLASQHILCIIWNMKIYGHI